MHHQKIRINKRLTLQSKSNKGDTKIIKKHSEGLVIGWMSALR